MVVPKTEMFPGGGGGVAWLKDKQNEGWRWRQMESHLKPGTGTPNRVAIGGILH